MKITKILTLFFLFVLSACTTVRVDQLRNATTAINLDSDRVVILGRNESAEFETEPELVSCLGSQLASGSNGLQVIPHQEFIDELYPWFEPRTAPLQPERLATFLQEPLIQNKMESFDIRYLIWISGDTQTIDSAGALSCGISPGAAGCFGFTTWEQEGNYEASIWDFDNLEEAGRISTGTRGTSYMPALIIPIPILARVQGNACESMGEQLRSFFQIEPTG